MRLAALLVSPVPAALTSVMLPMPETFWSALTWISRLPAPALPSVRRKVKLRDHEGARQACWLSSTPPVVWLTTRTRSNQPPLTLAVPMFDVVPGQRDQVARSSAPACRSPGRSPPDRAPRARSIWAALLVSAVPAEIVLEDLAGRVGRDRELDPAVGVRARGPGEHRRCARASRPAARSPSVAASYGHVEREERLPGGQVADAQRLRPRARGRAVALVAGRPGHRHGIARQPADGGRRREVGHDQVGIGRERRGQVQAGDVVQLREALGVGLDHVVGQVHSDREAERARAAVAVRQDEARLSRGASAADHGAVQRRVVGNLQIGQHLAGAGVAHDQPIHPRARGRHGACVAVLPLHRDRVAGLQHGARRQREGGDDQVRSRLHGRDGDVADLERLRIGRGVDGEVHLRPGALAAQDGEGPRPGCCTSSP